MPNFKRMEGIGRKIGIDRKCTGNLQKWVVRSHSLVMSTNDRPHTTSHTAIPVMSLCCIISKIQQQVTLLWLTTFEFVEYFWCEKNYRPRISISRRLLDNEFSCFDRKPECDRQTDRRTDNGPHNLNATGQRIIHVCALHTHHMAKILDQ